jgi:mannose-6-phosphate isomerase-like protein (cupin superfamily)
MSEKKPFTLELEKSDQYQQLLSGVPQTHGMRSGRVYLKPNDQCGEHSTKAHEELLTFLKGKGTAFVEEQEFEVKAGMVAYIPPHTIHNIKNTEEKGDLAYIYCVAPVQP